MTDIIVESDVVRTNAPVFPLPHIPMRPKRENTRINAPAHILKS